ncbi:hypothetical protein DXG01_002909 [Tephrocybe rancida]|nr:hypothetical protein DXG01_002909 [Tephrocybe rancida]
MAPPGGSPPPPKLKGLTRDDTIVLLFGQTGAGKSTFINRLVGEPIMCVGHDIKSQTQQVSHYPVPNPHNRRHKVVLVDTPGFDDYKTDDREILDKIVLWLKSLGALRLKVLIVYLVEIDQVRRINDGGMSPMKLVTAGIGTNIVVASTKWSCLKNEQIGARREPELHKLCSRTVHRFKDSTQAAWDIVDGGLNSPVVTTVEFANKLDAVLPQARKTRKQGRRWFAMFANLFSKEPEKGQRIWIYLLRFCENIETPLRLGLPPPLTDAAKNHRKNYRRKLFFHESPRDGGPIYCVVTYHEVFISSLSTLTEPSHNMSTQQIVLHEFDAKNMPFRRLGPSGLRVPVFSLGGWLTLGGSLHGDPVKDIIKTAFDAGINMFDTAEAYAGGQSEIEMGRVIKELGLRRTDLVITTKLFWGLRTGPNDGGLSRKHIIEGTKESLERLGLDYVDVLFAHRPDNTVPMEEIVRAFNYVIQKGWAFYWATSEWSALEIEEAYHVAEKLNLIAPIAEQCQHNMFYRERPEKEYEKYGLGTTTFSSLAAGLLTGKYNDGIPEGSRFATIEMFKNRVPSLQEAEGQEKIRKVRELTKLAADELQTTPGALALAWVAKNPNTSTVILGASSAEQLKENLKALDVLPRLTPEILEKIEAILNNKPSPPVNHGRPPLDRFGRL